VVGYFSVSGKQLKIGTFQPDSVALLLRIGWHFSTGLSGTFQPDWVALFNRIGWHFCSGICIYFPV